MIVNDKLEIILRNDIPVVSSREIAKKFGKTHENIVECIENLECSEEFRVLNIFRGQNKLEYLLTNDGVCSFIMNCSSDETPKSKIARISARNNMESAIKIFQACRISFEPMKEAIGGAYENPKLHYYTREMDLIYKIVLGMKSKKFREIEELHEETDIRDYISTEQRKMVDKLQVIDTGLIEVGMDYKERKKRLTAAYQKKISKLAAPCMIAASV